VGVSIGSVVLAIAGYLLGAVTVFIVQHCKLRQAGMITSPRVTETAEGRGQGEVMYENILPHGKEKDTVIELATNVAYDTASKKEH